MNGLKTGAATICVGLLTAGATQTPPSGTAGGMQPPTTEVNVTNDLTHRYGEVQIAINPKNPNNLGSVEQAGIHGRLRPGSASLSLLSAVSLAVLSAVQSVGGTQTAPVGVAPIQSINHLHIRVSDTRRSYEFYSKLLGGAIIDTSRGGWTFMMGDTGSWLSLGTVPPQIPNVKPASLDHIGIGINLPDKPDPLRQALKEAFPFSNVRSPGKPGDLTYDRSIYVEDPDGISLQLISKTDDGHLPRPDATPVVPRTQTAGVVRVRSINHLQLNVTDVAKTQTFYSKLLGATTRDKSASGRMMTMTLPRANSWLSFGTVDDKEKAGKLDHIGIGIDWPQDVEALRTALKKAFTDAKVTSPGTPTSSTYNRSIYIEDPDGLRVQLISSTDDGKLPGGTLSAK